MASGKKNYFRHSASARKDSKLVNLISNYGKEAYYHYFALLEMCAEKALAEDLKGDEEFVFHKRTVCAELMVTPQRLSGHLLAIQSSLLGDLVVTSDQVKIKFDKLPKYLGRYENKISPNSSKERKEKERKENKIITDETKRLTPDEVVDLWNREFAKPSQTTPGLGSGKHLDNCIESLSHLKTLGDWRTLFSKATSNEFLSSGIDSWRVNLLWLVDYDNALKVLSGNFEKENNTQAIIDDFIKKVQK